MNEEELFRAYAKGKPHTRTMTILPPRQITGPSVKCRVPACPTMIAAWANRDLCRFHEHAGDRNL